MPVTVDQLRLHQLRKQYLVGTEQIDFFDLTKKQLGLHSTDYWTPYLSAWARVGDYNPGEVFDALNTGRQLVRVSVFRGTTYVVHVENLEMILGATGPLFEESARTHPDMKKMTEKAIEDSVENLRNILGNDPLTTNEIKQLLPKEGKILQPLMRIAMARGVMVRANAIHARSNRTSYAFLPDWISRPKFKPMPQEKALTHLVKSYIETFGPVTIDDLAWWLGLKKTVAQSVVTHLAEDITTIKQEKAEYYMISEDLDLASSVDPMDESFIWFLPYEDHFPKAFTERTWCVNEETKSILFPRLSEHYWPPKLTPPPKGPHKGMFRQGEIRPSIWQNGRTVGRWEMEPDNGEYRVIYGLFRKVGKPEKELIEQRKEELERFINNRLLPIS